MRKWHKDEKEAKAERHRTVATATQTCGASTRAREMGEPEHPCRFPFLFPFFPFLFFCLRFFPLLFVVLRVPFLAPFSFVFAISSCRFPFDSLVSPSSLLLSHPCFPWWRILLFRYFVLALHSPRASCEPEVCVFPLRDVFFSFLRC